MKKINIIIPTYNEEKNIISLVKSIKKNLPKAKICIVDDSINDNIKKKKSAKKMDRLLINYKFFF